MVVVPLKFRCYQCNGLLGVSRSKVGAVVSCPKCRAELIVPEPLDADGAEAVPSPEGVSTSDAGQPFDVLDINPEDIRVEPGIDLPRRPPVEAPSRYEEYGVAPAEEPPASPPPEVVPPPFLPAESATDPVVPPIRVEPPRIAEPRWTPPRTRDVILPRSAVATWSLFVLLAQGMAFIAGLLAGHFLWRVH